MTIPQGGSILKHGQVIGRASRPLKAGEHAHVHNIESARLTKGSDHLMFEQFTGIKPVDKRLSFDTGALESYLRERIVGLPVFGYDDAPHPGSLVTVTSPCARARRRPGRPRARRAARSPP